MWHHFQKQITFTILQHLRFDIYFSKKNCYCFMLGVSIQWRAICISVLFNLMWLNEQLGIQCEL